MARVWWCAIDRNEGWATYEELKARNVVAQGWPVLGDLSRLGTLTPERIKEYVKNIDDTDAPAKTFENLLINIKTGDLVVGIEGTQVKGVCTILPRTTYLFNLDQNFENVSTATLAQKSKDQNNFTGFDYAHCLYPVQWIDWKDAAPDDWKLAVPRQGVKGIMQVRQDAEAVEQRWSAYEQSLHGSVPWSAQWLHERLERLKRMKGQLEMNEISDIFGIVGQVILFGPPGTGKTYKALQIAARLLGLPETSDEFEQSRFGKGTGQSGCWQIVQFHPSYNYEDFVRGIQVETRNGQAEYRPVDRIFAQMCIAAAEQKDAKYIIIIDEINRANVPAVLGELLYALEYRDKPVTTLYAPSNKLELIVPRNLYVIGTMNTADRSIGHLDYAIRRRFAFLRCRAKRDEVEQYYAEQQDGLRQSALEKFEGVAQLFASDKLSADYRADDVQIGHTYFFAKTESELRSKFRYQVIPLLEEYLADGVLRREAESKINELRVTHGG